MLYIYITYTCVYIYIYIYIHIYIYIYIVEDPGDGVAGEERLQLLGLVRQVVGDGLQRREELGADQVLRLVGRSQMGVA